MPSEPAYYPLIRVAIAAAAVVAVFVIVGAIGALIDPGMRAVAAGAVQSLGTAWALVAGAVFIGGLALWARSGSRQDERRRIAETGTLDHRRPFFVREGLGRNLAFLLSPLAGLIVIGLVMWLTGVSLPPITPP